MNKFRQPTMKTIPDWTIQTCWWVSGIFATGAVWYFLSIKNYQGVVVAGIGAVAFAMFAIALHRQKDKYASPKDTNRDEIVIQVGEEKITFTELLRSFPFDVVKVNAHTHMLGVAAEHQWIQRRYPDSRLNSQALTTLDSLQNSDDKPAVPIHFDVMSIELSDGRKKKIYFDISSFFSGRGSLLDPSSAVSEKLREIYKPA
jgi:hypothetical protein